MTPNIMKKAFLFGLTLASTLGAQAVIYSTNWNSGFVNGTTILDNNPSGWTDSRTVSTMPAGTLTAVAVNLELSSGWSGDLYAYLVHSAGFAVLLDRVGTPGQTFGYGTSDLNVTLVDNGTAFGATLGNIHNFGGAGAASGQWNSDNSATTSGSGSLGSFLSTSPNGMWSLFIADLSGGGVTTVQSWGLQLDIVAVPEVESWVAAALAGAFGAFWVNRQIWGRRASDV